jgi:protein disulfide-isomerase A6
MVKSQVIFAVLSLLLISVAAEDMYNKYSNVVELTDADFKSKVLESDEMWLIEFYAPWCGHCQKFKPSYEKAAKILKGVVKVGAVNGDVHQLGGNYGVTGFPTIVFFGLDKKKAPETFQGARESDAVVDYALNQVRSNVKARQTPKKASDKKEKPKSEEKAKTEASGDKDVVVLDHTNFERLVLGSKDIWMIEFYAPWCGHCKSLEPEWNTAAFQLKGQVKLGKVNADEAENKGLASRYGVKGFPSIKVLDYGEGKTDSKAYNYEGARTAADIVKFASDLADKADIIPDIHQTIHQKVYDKHCQGTVICIIAFLPNIYETNAVERNNMLKSLTGSAKTNRRQPFKWFWIAAGDQLDLERSLNLGFGFPAIIAISPQKNLISTMRSSFSEANVNQYLKDLQLGKGRLEDLKAKITLKKADKWDGKDAPPLEDDSPMDYDL